MSIAIAGRNEAILPHDGHLGHQGVRAGRAMRTRGKRTLSPVLLSVMVAMVESDEE